MTEIECFRCRWQGTWEECEVDEGEHNSICPDCNAFDSMVEREDDGVSDDDYRDQNPQEVPGE